MRKHQTIQTTYEFYKKQVHKINEEPKLFTAEELAAVPRKPFTIYRDGSYDFWPNIRNRSKNAARVISRQFVSIMHEIALGFGGFFIELDKAMSRQKIG